MFGLWAYDAAWALAKAVEKAGAHNLKYKPATNISAMEMNSSNYLYSLGVNENGVKLRDALSKVSFKGLAGMFNLIDGELESSVFEIVNLVDNGRRNVGFWLAESGLRRKLKDHQHGSRSRSSTSGLRTIIWPGEADFTPKGWEVPTNRKKLRVGVPIKSGFLEFVKVGSDPKTNETKVSGYCVDVFKAVVEALHYDVAYEFIPISIENSDIGASYNDLAYRLFLGVSTI